MAEFFFCLASRDEENVDFKTTAFPLLLLESGNLYCSNLLMCVRVSAFETRRMIGREEGEEKKCVSCVGVKVCVVRVCV